MYLNEMRAGAMKLAPVYLKSTLFRPAGSVPMSPADRRSPLTVTPSTMTAGGTRRRSKCSGSMTRTPRIVENQRRPSFVRAIDGCTPG